MALRSQLFRGDPKLELCLVRDAAHIQQGASGAHVAKIQKALIRLDSADISDGEKAISSYGPSTANAVLEYSPNQFDPPGVPFAATQRTDPDPRVSVCTPFFAANSDLQRDVITHEFFHLQVGIVDKSVRNTNDALTNANTLAQIVAWINDRNRQANSDGNEAAVPPLPSP